MFKRFFQTPPTPQQMATTFRRLGWIGFWCQVILGFIPVVLLFFQWFFSSKNISIGVPDSGNIISFLDLLTLIFTIYWCFRYTRLANKIGDYDQRPTKVRVIREVWIGIIANVAVIFLATLIAIVTVGGLLFVILSLPQGAATILQPVPGGKIINPGPIIVPMDILGLLALMCVILAGLVGVIVSLYLLSRLIIWKKKSHE